MGFKRRYQNIVEKFLSGDAGKRFFQIFYSVGAAVVIIGALAKITHWPYNLGNILLTTGLLTEFFVFLISAFDTPVKDYQWDRVFPVLDTNDADDRPVFGNGGGSGGSVVVGSGVGSATGVKGAGVGAIGVAASGGTGGAIIIGGASFGGANFGGTSSGGFGGGVTTTENPKNAVEAVEAMTPGQVRQSFGIPNAVNISEEDSNALTTSIKKMAAAADQLGKMAEVTDATQQYLDKLTEMSENMSKFSTVTNSLTDVSDVLLNSYKSITDNSDGINQSSRGYVHQMEALNRNIQGLNTIYEIQLKSISSQIDAIERINSGLMRIKDLYEGSIVDSSVFRTETEKMSQQLHALNGVYNRLLNAMTMNMYGAGGNSHFNAPI
ncbi:MAG: gliding motility protein GldL [Candidatus Symbiothrix sp.]|jgi:gliding motility-associated protein GldL|nr:gliding motility protein GldL [Candidatus Symbiothrix sp.]